MYPVGVTTKKNTKPITIGDIILPRSIPNLNHNKFNGVKRFELIKPKIKKINEIIKDQTLKLPSKKIGYIATAKKNTKNTIPKLLFDPAFIFSIV